MKKYTEDFTSMSLDEQDKIIAAVNKLNCEPVMICRASNHPNNSHIFVVIGQYIKPHSIYGKSYCVWTANTGRSESEADLYFGNYGVSFKNALKIVDEKVSDYNEPMW
jgi:hypothetical protein